MSEYYVNLYERRGAQFIGGFHSERERANAAARYECLIEPKTRRIGLIVYRPKKG